MGFGPAPSEGPETEGSGRRQQQLRGSGDLVSRVISKVTYGSYRYNYLAF